MKKITFPVLAFMAAGLFLTAFNNASAQVITTVAGIGFNGFSGDNSAATAAELSYVEGVATDASGNLYIADASNNRIRKVDNSGTITTFAGNGAATYSGDGAQATLAALNTPSDVAVDAAGNVYIADYYNNVVRKVSTSGIITTVAGNGTYGYSGDNGQATAAELSRAIAVCVDAAGNIYISDYSQAIRKVSTSGVITTIAGTGTGGYSGDGGQATLAKINTPQGLCVDASGNVYFCDEANNRVRKISTSGVITTVAGNGTGGFSGDGLQATAAELSYPFGVSMDASGNMYIADENNNRIRKVSTSGVITTFAGTGTAGFSGDGGAPALAELNNPYRMCFMGTTMYLADNGNKAVRKIAAPSSVNNIDNNEAISLFPNPSNGVFTLQVSGEELGGKSTVEVYNMMGEKIYSTYTIQNSNFNVDISGRPNGIYLVKVQGENGKTLIKRIEITR